jgi:undecaprenyl diphosphate synthase
MPRHVGVILDGNRRHARKRGLSDPCEIYQRGAEKLDDILDWCAELHIPALSGEQVQNEWINVKAKLSNQERYAMCHP